MFTLPPDQFAHLFVPPAVRQALKEVYGEYRAPYPVEATFDRMLADIAERLQEVGDFFEDDPARVAWWRGVQAALKVIEALRGHYSTAMAPCPQCYKLTPVTVDVTAHYSLAADGAIARREDGLALEFYYSACGKVIEVDEEVSQALAEAVSRLLNLPATPA
jgi:hypothetical protein